MIEDFKIELQEKNPSFILSKWVLERVPIIFNDCSNTYIEYKELISKNIGIDSKAILFTGSSCCGFSLNPTKNYREFNSESDIDIAVISQHHFDISWHYLRNLKSEIYAFTPKQKFSIMDHRNRLIYWGTIATDKILEILPFGREWSQKLLELQKNKLFQNREIKLRIYKDFEALRAYHLNNFLNLRNELLKNNTDSDEIILEHNP